MNERKNVTHQMGITIEYVKYQRLNVHQIMHVIQYEDYDAFQEVGQERKEEYVMKRMAVKSE